MFQHGQSEMGRCKGIDSVSITMPQPQSSKVLGAVADPENHPRVLGTGGNLSALESGLVSGGALVCGEGANESTVRKS